MPAVEHAGCSLAYAVRGPADGPRVLFIQGTGVHGEGWRPQVDALALRYRCATFDNRGVGHSQPAGAALTVPQMAEDALAVMTVLGWESAHVVGHSLGGLIALQLALAHRRRVRSLALLCTFARGRDVTRLTLWMLGVALRSRLGPRRARRRAFLEMVLTPAQQARTDLDALAEKLADDFGHDLAEQPAVAMKQLRALRACDLRPRLHELAGIPSLVVSAELDRIARPEFGRALSAGLPRARYIELPDAAHGVPLTEPERINRLLLEHLAAL